MDINDVRNKIDGMLAMFKHDAAFQNQVQLNPSRSLDSVGLSLNQLYDSKLEYNDKHVCTPRYTM